MRRSRREILGTIGAVSTLGLAGCPSGGIDYTTPAGSSGGDTSSASSPTPTTDPGRDPTETPTRTPEPTETPTPQPSQLRTDTERVFAEIEWFATSYPGAVDRGLGLAGRVHDVVGNLRRTPRLTEDDRRRIENATGEYHALLNDQFAPHFPAGRVEEIVRQSREHVATIRTFSERGDLDRADRELSELAALFGELSTRSEFVATFPDFPIRSPPLEYLTTGTYDDSTPLSFVVGYPDEAYTTLVRADAPWEVRTRRTDSLSDRVLEAHFASEAAVFGGVDVQTGRTGRLFLDVHLNRDRARHTPVYVQRYADVERARRALSTVLDGSPAVEGTVAIGRTTWERIFYVANSPVDHATAGHVVRDGDGNVIYEGTHGSRSRDAPGSGPGDREDVVYTYLSRIGRYVIAAAPSATAWEERPDGTNDPLKETWLFA